MEPMQFPQDYAYLATHTLPARHPLFEYWASKRGEYAEKRPRHIVNPYRLENPFLTEAARFVVPATFDQVVCGPDNEPLSDDARAGGLYCVGEFVWDAAMSVVWFRLYAAYSPKSNPRVLEATLCFGHAGRVGKEAAVLCRSNREDNEGRPEPRSVSTAKFADGVLTSCRVAELYAAACNGTLYWTVSGTVDVGGRRADCYATADEWEGIGFVRGQFSTILGKR